jgi:hypothetical protein
VIFFPVIQDRPGSVDHTSEIYHRESLNTEHRNTENICKPDFLELGFQMVYLAYTFLYVKKKFLLIKWSRLVLQFEL